MNLNHSFFRFLLVGAINTACGLSIILLFINLFHIEYWWATFIGNCIGALVSYTLNKRFTFKNTTTSAKKNFMPFVIVILLSYFVAYSLGLLITDSLKFNTNIPEQWIKNLSVFVGSGFYTILNYIGQRFFVFRENNS
ncbi:GtrA family protein [Paenibacillus sp. S-38]|uniref:GtrA family protein n=1 Tax=Paenibacillus sp. S-38 TaxID=3416710 RepID=UPI003CFB4424